MHFPSWQNGRPTESFPAHPCIYILEGGADTPEVGEGERETLRMEVNVLWSQTEIITPMTYVIPLNTWASVGAGVPTVPSTFDICREGDQMNNSFAEILSVVLGL